MYARMVTMLLVSFVIACECSDLLEGRGKKKKIALLVYFADLIVKKIFIFKLIYAFLLWCVIHKAGYFLTWFVHYLKEKKKDHEHHGFEYLHHGPHYHYEDYGYGKPSYIAYNRGRK